MPAGVLDTKPKNAPWVTVRRNDVGGVGLDAPPPPPPLVLAVTAPVIAQPVVQLFCQTGLVPVAAKLTGKLTPAWPGSTMPAVDPVGVIAPVAAFIEKLANPPLRSSA